MNQGPHRAIDSALDGLANGAKGVIGSIASGVKSAGEAVMTGLDGPIRDTLKTRGPHRVIDEVLDGQVEAVTNAWSNGAIGSLQMIGEGVMRGLDIPVEDIGGIGGFQLPKMR